MNRWNYDSNGNQQSVGEVERVGKSGVGKDYREIGAQSYRYVGS